MKVYRPEESKGGSHSVSMRCNGGSHSVTSKGIAGGKLQE